MCTRSTSGSNEHAHEHAWSGKTLWLQIRKTACGDEKLNPQNHQQSIINLTRNMLSILFGNKSRQHTANLRSNAIDAPPIPCGRLFLLTHRATNRCVRTQRQCASKDYDERLIRSPQGLNVKTTHTIMTTSVLKTSLTGRVLLHLHTFWQTSWWSSFMLIIWCTKYHRTIIRSSFRQSTLWILNNAPVL